MKTRKASIRRFIALWISAVWVSIGLLVGGLLYVIPHLNSKTQRIFVDGQTLQTNELFELAIVAGSREALRGNAIHTVSHVTHHDAIPLWLKNADSDLTAMEQQADTTTERELVSHIADSYAIVRRVALSSAPDSLALQKAVDPLLMLVHQHREFEIRESAATLRSSHELDRSIERFTWEVTLLASVLLLSGSILLWQRIFLPMLGLSQAVRAFGDDLQARAPVVRDDEMGEVCHTFNVMADLIREREQERLRFVATVAHDLKNPLTFIGAAAHLLRDKDLKLSAEDKMDWLDRILNSSRRIESTIGDLMDGVQAETGRLMFDMVPFDYAVLVSETTREFATNVHTHPIACTEIQSCWIKADRKRLERVLTNLLSNAAKYSMPGKEIAVSLRTHEGQAVLTVRDQGEGIAPEDLPKLFQPFSRLERTKNMAKGTGLGLSSVRKIIEGHHGTIHVESVLGNGTTFEVRLPTILAPHNAQTSAEGA